MVDAQESPDATKAVTFNVEFERQLFGLLVVAQRTRLWRVLATAQLALIALIFGVGESSFDLASGVLAMGTMNHA